MNSTKYADLSRSIGITALYTTVGRLNVYKKFEVSLLSICITIIGMLYIALYLFSYASVLFFHSLIMQYTIIDSLLTY